jgi:hypothetical protein
MSREIFGKFIEFLLKGLIQFKIQTKFKVDLFPRFYFKIHLEFEILSQSKVVPFEVTFHLAKFGQFWSSRRIDFVFSKSE